MSALHHSLSVAARHARGEHGDLVTVLVNSRSKLEANLAVVMLRDLIPESELVGLCNLRELLAAIPVAPFVCASELGSLERVLGYTHFKGSWSRLVRGSGTLAGLEFVGDGNRVDEIVLHVGHQRIALSAGDTDFIDADVVDILLRIGSLGTALVEGLRVLGTDISPPFYLSVTDYVVENAAQTLGDFGGLF